MVRSVDCKQLIYRFVSVFVHSIEASLYFKSNQARANSYEAEGTLIQYADRRTGQFDNFPSTLERI